MSLLHESDVDLEGPTRTFRAATIEEALAEARAELGSDVRIIEANRIRRGGVGGFFATELGVELVVSPGDGTTSDGDVPHGTSPGFEPFEPEYIGADRLDAACSDSAPAGRSTPFPRASAAATDADDRPQFYDREIEETPADVPPPGIARLLDSASRAEQGGQPLVPRSFAEHLAGHLGADTPAGLVSTPSRRPLTGGSSPAEVEAGIDRQPTTPAAMSEREMRAVIERAAQAMAGDGVTRSEPRHEPLHETRHEAAPEAERPQAAVPNEAPEPIAAPETNAAPETPTTPDPVSEPRAASARAVTSGRSGRTRDPMRRPIDLAAGAVGRIVEQLSDVAPVDGSRMHDLSRLMVKVTLPDGAIIEISAELNGGSDV